MSNKLKPAEVREYEQRQKEANQLQSYYRTTDKQRSQQNAIEARKAMIKTGEKK